jgi:hypothetical protein
MGDSAMKRFRIVSILFFIPLAVALVGSVGCSKDKDKTEDKKGSDNKSGGDDKTAPAGAPEELAGKGVGVLKGKVTFVGDPPERRDLTETMKNNPADFSHCTAKDPKNDTRDEEWIVGPDKGVKNVVVWLRAPKGKYFKVPDDQKKAKGDVVVDQPFCAFVPHVVVVFPSYFDGKKQEPTGQRFKVLNSAPMNHNTAYGTEFGIGKSDNQTLKPKSELIVDAIPSGPRKTGENLIKFKCDIHKWMKGYAWVFDHPFSAVTGEDGSYEIKGVPTGVDLEVVYWHESMGGSKPDGQKNVLKDGENTKNFTIKP